MRAGSGRLAAFLVVLAAGPASGGERGDPARAPVVRSVAWRGVQALAEKELAGHVFTQAPSWKPWVAKPVFDPQTLERDLERIVALYRRYGYYEASAGHELVWDRERLSVRVTFVVEEGVPVRLGALAIELPEEGHRDPALADVVDEELPLRLGEPFSLRSYGAAKQELLGRLANAGHPRARIEGGAEVDVASRSARVAWQVEPGPRVVFGPVRVTGLEGVQESLVRREVMLEEGARFSLDALRTTRERVQKLGLFRSVIVQPRPDEASEGPEPEGSPTVTWPVELRVQERPLRSLRVGLGWGTEDRLRGQLSWLHRNFLGEARRLELGLRYSSLLSAFDAGFEQPRFLDPELVLRADGSVRQERQPGYDADRVLTRLEARRPIGGPWSARAAYQFEWDDITNVAADEAELDDPTGSLVLSFFELGARRSTLDDSLDPGRGTWLDLWVEPSLPVLGSEVGYLELGVEGRGFRALGPGVVAARLRLATLDPFGSTSPDEIPAVKRFFSGGSNSVRGFEFQRLGPLDADDDPIGGTSLFEASLEWRFPIWRSLGGVTFVDAGQLALDPFTWRLDDVFYSSGLGVRYRTPVGPLRLDFGYVLNPPDGVGRSRIHLSVGHSF